ncbi:MAG: hypothetical protein ABIR57_15360, partial [Aeromicrobium sp.]
GPNADRWANVMMAFDVIRAQAFEKGRAELLTSVYPQGSSLLEDDRRLLETYTRRGLLVDDMRMQVLRVRLVGRSNSLIRLDVVDQLSAIRVRMPGGALRELPRDRPTRRIVELSLTEDGWRISAVRQR